MQQMTEAVEIASGRAARRLGIVVATPAAARCFARPAGSGAPLVVTSYGDTGRARTAARQLAAQGARALVSFGPAVGLAPALRPGDLVIAECVVLPSGATIPTDRAWRTELGAA
jgi:adenosylhomocysteine nucleosidase